MEKRKLTPEEKHRMFWAIAPVGCDEKYPGVPYSVCARLARIEQANRTRARKAGCESEPVDFILICVEQEWKCCICGEPMDMLLKGDKQDSVSLEHIISLGQGGVHKWTNIGGAHKRCNLHKGRTEDTPKAAKIKRQAGETGQYARRQKAKAEGRYRGIQSRGFQKPPEGYKYQWSKK